MSTLRTVFFLALSLGLSGCVVSTITGATSKERPVGRSIDDTSAGMAIGARMRRFHDGDLSGVRVAVEDGFVLLSGNVPTPELRLDAERIAWTAPKVVKVANEIEVTGKRGFLGNAKDRWITTQVRTRIFSDNAVRSVNINIETRNKVVYLLGLVRTEGEIKRATGHARLVPGVKKVVSYLSVAQRYQQQELDGGPQQ